MLQTAPAPEASEWLASFSRQLAGGDADAILELFAEDCYWRDFVAFTWNIITLEGRDELVSVERAHGGMLPRLAFLLPLASGLGGRTRD